MTYIYRIQIKCQYNMKIKIHSNNEALKISKVLLCIIRMLIMDILCNVSSHP